MKFSAQVLTVASFCGLFLFMNRAQGQFIIDVQSNPDSASVYLNNELQGKTPLSIKFKWVNVPSEGMTFKVEKEGYKSQEFVLSEKPRNIHLTKKVNLEQIKVHFDCDSAGALVGFDKLLIEFSSGKEIGKLRYGGRTTDLTWEGFSRAGSEEFAPKAYDVLGNIGFLTPQILENQLFSSEKRIKKYPRFVIGGQVKDIWLDMEQVYTTVKAKNRITVQWQILDRSTNSVVYKAESNGEVEAKYIQPMDLRPITDLFGAALYNFLANGKLYELVKAAGTASTVFVEEPTVEDSVKVTRLNPRPIFTVGLEEPTAAYIQLKPVKIEKFESSPAMIQYVTEGCVTVSTDAGHGSGAFISEDGLVITAAHVVTGVNRVSVILPSGVELEAKVQAIDELYDVALLKVAGSRFRALPLGKGLAMGLGEEVVTVGTPGDIDLGQSVSKGILSGKRKQEDIIYMQTDVSVSPGNSGGPLLNKEGYIIGIIQRKLIGQGIEGVGFALPIETALKRLGLKMPE